MFFQLRTMLIFAVACGLFAACGSVQTKGSSGSRSDAAATAKRYLGTPYRYGGSDPRGFDCSGFVLYVFRQHGVALPHNAADQFARLKSVRTPEAGDLVFFNTFGRGVSHVGIYTGKDTFIHSPREGKTVEYADMRIDYWRAAYRGARRAL
ncbi:MAG: C40 family peptidase [Spirochaetota bacterium]|jgi:cell wall-associated NlpC family hydrolase|nr:C40 family peptidase [Spirochaetota bacterium]